MLTYIAIRRTAATSFAINKLFVWVSSQQTTQGRRFNVSFFFLIFLFFHLNCTFEGSAYFYHWMWVYQSGDLFKCILMPLCWLYGETHRFFFLFVCSALFYSSRRPPPSNMAPMTTIETVTITRPLKVSLFGILLTIWFDCDSLEIKTHLRVLNNAKANSYRASNLSLKSVLRYTTEWRTSPLTWLLSHYIVKWWNFSREFHI